MSAREVTGLDESTCTKVIARIRFLTDRVVCELVKRRVCNASTSLVLELGELAEVRSPEDFLCVLR